MSEKRKLATWKLVVLGSLGVLLFLDLGLGIFLWHLHQSDPAALRRQRADLETKDKLLKADVSRVEAIRKNMPEVGKQAQEFYEKELPLETNGYSGIIADLGEVATKAGLRTAATGFHEKELKGRGVTEISIGESVEGDYGSVLKFIQGLERSKNFYLLDDLTLDRAESGRLHLTLELRTYFRS